MAATGDDELEELIERQITYYRARAPEYDRWWNRTHQYQLEPELQEAWAAEVHVLHDWLDTLPLSGDVLELACGTGTWTGLLAQRAASVTAIDASPEVIEINQSKPGRADVRFIEADVFSWEPMNRYDAVFFGFWLSHVPPPLFGDFWWWVRMALRPGGTAAFVDNRFSPGRDWPPERPAGYVQERTDLSDGSHHEVVKVYFEPDELRDRLRTDGWQADVGVTETYFLYGTARPLDSSTAP